MSEETTYTTVDAVNFALTGKPVEFEAAIKSLLADRLPAAVEAKREEVAKITFPGAVTDEPAEEETAEVEAKSEEQTETPIEEE